MSAGPTQALTQQAGKMAQASTWADGDAGQQGISEPDMQKPCLFTTTNMDSEQSDRVAINFRHSDDHQTLF